MSPAILSAAPPERAWRACPPVDSLIVRFAPECRMAVARACARDPRLADLARSFPALLHRIATRRDEAAAAAVLGGAKLRDAAACAGLPLWTRRLPPEAFAMSSPDLPDGQSLSRRIPNCLPRGRRSARGWLDRVAEAAHWGEEEFVLWVARETRRAPTAIDVGYLPMLALHAFYSTRPHTFGCAVARERWSPATGPQEAQRRASDWFDSARLAVQFGRLEIDPVCAAGIVDGFEFVPILSASALVEEAAALDNCLRMYGRGIVDNVDRVWSVRRKGRRVAALCVEFGEAPFPQIAELRGPGNTPAPADVWHAVRKWLDGQEPTLPPLVEVDRPLDRQLWIKLWKPYWLARRGAFANVPLSPCEYAIGQIRWPDRRRRRRRRRPN